MKYLIFTLLISISFTAAADCLRLLQDTHARIHPQKIFVPFKKDDIFKIIKKSPDGRQVLSERNGQKVVLYMDQVAEELCLYQEYVKERPAEVKPPEPQVTEAGEKASFWKNVRWGLDYQMHLSTSASRFRDLITPIPDPSDVSALQDPLIIDVSRGSGSAFRLTGEFTSSDRIDLRAHIGQRKLSYKYKKKLNPGLSPISLDSLPTSEDSFQISHYGIGFGGKYYFSNSSESTVRIFVGGEAEILYANSSEIVIDALVGSFFKNTPTTVRTKIEQLSSDGQLNVGVSWHKFNLSLGVSPYMAYVITLGGWLTF